MKQKIPTLPFIESVEKKWSYLYAYNIRIIRDIFVYCAFNEKLTKSALYKAMDENIIPPPRDRWVNPKRKFKDRLKLEYLHAARYLGFIKVENNILAPDFSKNVREKKIILEENKRREFRPSQNSPAFSDKEKKAMLKIVLNYERARDFLRWFLDFDKYTDIWSFNEKDFQRDALPIYVLSKIEKGKKGREIIKREIDNKLWKIPHDYIRIASFVFPNWFRELGIIDNVVVFPEFSFDGNLWYMYYPLKMTDEKFLRLDLSEVLYSMFLENRTERTIRIPYMLYAIAKRFHCSTNAIKLGIEMLYRKDPTHFYLERVPLHLMKRKKIYRDSYMEVDGFFMSYIKIYKDVLD